MKKLLLLLALIPAFFSCKHETNYIVTPNFTLENVVFTPADADSVRCEVAAFENDEYGISLVDGSSYSPKNVKYRVYRDNTNLVCDENPIKLDNDTMTVHAYGPYSESFDPEKSVEDYTVLSDQSTYSGVKASNLVVAVVPGMDSDNPYIALRPESQVTRIEVLFSGKYCKNVTECVVMARTNSKIDEIGNGIKMYKGSSGNDEVLWYAYIPCQSFRKGTAVITYKDGANGEITIGSDYTAMAGTVRRFKRTLN
ncbi:MAG: fimbrillin family protein [Treponema sp.]|nr:fimbrillin family protein [Treponema sp.]